MNLLLVMLCLLAQSQTASVPRLYPVDDTPRDSSFRSYVKKLRTAVTARNTEALRKLVDPEVVVGPDKEDAGWLKFESVWQPEDSHSAVWSALDDLLSLGFVREHPRLFLSPYLVWRFPRELNRGAYLVVVRDKAPLRVEPSVRAAEAAELSFDVVEQVGPAQAGEGLGKWVRVRTADGHSGFLNMRDVMSPMMPRAQFGMRHGKWMMIALESPDR